MELMDPIHLKAINKLKKVKESSSLPSFYELEIYTIQGKPLELAEYKGKYILLVNVASNCGFTKQYRALQKLSETYPDQLIVIGLPCNQFGNQEPGDESAIKSFCEVRFGVSFPMTEKIKVKGSEQHPIYQWLTKKSLNGKNSSSVHWNFQKYLLDPKGKLVDVYYSTTSPLSKKITRHFQRGLNN